jgi:hypothetical protein
MTPEAGPVPIVLTALTLNKYEVPFVNPVIVAESEVYTPSAKT